MSFNPEQIPKLPDSEQNIPHSYEPVAPDARRIEPGIPAPDNTYVGFEELPPKTHERADWDQKKADVRNSVITTPEQGKKSNRNLFIGLGAGALALGVAASTWFGATAGGKINPVPQPITPTAEAPVTPGAGTPVETPSGQAEVTPVPTITPENREGRGSDTYIFLGPDGETEQTLEQLSTSINIPVSENKDTIEAQTTYYKKMEEMVNYFPTEKEVRNNLNIPEGQQLEVEDYLAAVKLHNKAYDGLYETPSGTLYDFMQELSVQVAAAKIETINSGETLYEPTIDFARTEPEFVVRDNAKNSSIDDVNPMAGTYELTFTGFGPNKTNGENPVWLVDGNVVVTKKAE